MSDLLNKASLVVIPSGYKEDTVYSVVPSDGSGDLSFTRASNGTRINSAGLVEVCPWNLLEQSEDFTNAFWFASNATVTANSTTAPNGTTTADTIAFTSGGYIGKERTDNGAMTFFVYAKYIATRWLCVENYNQSDKAAWFDLQNGVVGGTDNGATSAIENVGNGWYKCSVTMTATSAASSIYAFFTVSANNGFTRSGSAYLWGAQLNIGSTAKPYFPTTDRLNVPRLTYQNGGGGCPALLLEKQSTNELSYSEEFDNAAWNKHQCSISANQTTSPDGTQNADKIVENTANDEHVVYRSIDGTNKTFSFYAKSAGRDWVAVLSNNSNYTYFNISNGTLGTIAATSTATIENAGNGWYRCTVYNTHQTFGAVINLATANGTVVYTGNGTSGVYLYGAQLEASSYATSYINTTSSSATRVADACYKTGISSLIGQTSGTVFVDAYIDNIEARANNILFYLLGASQDKYVLITSSGGVRYIDFPNGEITNNGYGLTNGRHKFAIAYANNDFAFYIDGNLIGTDTSGTPSACSEFGFFYYASGYDFPLKVNQAVLFKTRLTNAELASLTTI